MPTPTIPTCHAGFDAMQDEYSYWLEPEQIEGVIPADLQGTFFRNGPGRMKVGNEQFGHWFDGDGMICRFSFSNGRVHFANKFVQTPKYIADSKANNIVTRGFGTQIKGGWLKNIFRAPANPANTNSMVINGQLLALYEGGRPFLMDALDLSTQGEFNFAGQLTSFNMFSAHGRYHHQSKHFINFSAGVNNKFKPCLYLYKINQQGELISKTSFDLSAMPFCHDFVLTQEYAIVTLNSATMSGLGKMMLGVTTMADLLTYHPQQPMRMLVFSLHDFSLVRELSTEAGNLVHLGNAWQTSNAEQQPCILMDAMYLDNFDANETIKDVYRQQHAGGGEYRRYCLNMDTLEVSFSKLSEHLSEFPTYNRHFTGIKSELGFSAVSFANGADTFFNAIQRIDPQGNQLKVLPKGYYGSEPLFVATNALNERQGYVLELVYNAHAHQSELHILNPMDLEQAYAVIKLSHHIPHQFHGNFVATVFV